jgi:hypothetical protein
MSLNEDQLRRLAILEYQEAVRQESQKTRNSVTNILVISIAVIVIILFSIGYVGNRIDANNARHAVQQSSLNN